MVEPTPVRPHLGHLLCKQIREVARAKKGNGKISIGFVATILANHLALQIDHLKEASGLTQIDMSCLQAMKFVTGHYPGPYFYNSPKGILQFPFRHLNLRSRASWKMARPASPTYEPPQDYIDVIESQAAIRNQANFDRQQREEEEPPFDAYREAGTSAARAGSSGAAPSDAPTAELDQFIQMVD